MKNTFFVKLLSNWDEATSEAFKLLLKKDPVVDSLEGRVETVR